MTQKLILSVFANNVSDHLANDHPHFVEREGPQRLGADVATRADTQRKVAASSFGASQTALTSY